MPAGTYDLTVECGATFDTTFTWTTSAGSAVNLSGYTARLQIRESVDAAATLVSLTSSSGITLGGAAGTIQVVISATATAAITARTGVYDLELVSGGGVVTRLLEGSVVFVPEVTR